MTCLSSECAPREEAASSAVSRAAVGAGSPDDHGLAHDHGLAYDHGFADDRGMATAEYAIATLAACGFAGLLLSILGSDEVRSMLLAIVRQALTLA
ncbi:MAG: DUF4244 domain-containing protein [Actinomycetales bacterium]